MLGLRKKCASAGIAAVALGLAVGTAEADPTMNLVIDEDATTLGERPGSAMSADTEIGGGLWVSNTGNVVSDHNLTTTNSDTEGTPFRDAALPDLNPDGTIAAIWQFEVTGSSGDDWDAVENGNWKFDLSWDGNLLDDTVEGGNEIPMPTVHFSHVGTQAGSFGQWVLNNNSQATPGALVDPVWTYFDIADTDNLTGSLGTFALIADADTSLFNLDTNPLSVGDDDVYAAAIANGTGTLTAVPSPTAAMAGLAAFGMMGMSLRRPGRRRAEA